MQFTTDMLKPVTAPGAKARANVASVILSLNEYGDRLGLDQPHRFAQYACQLAHESGGFVHDVEVWGKNGGTAAQKRYEDRKDLGHSTAVDGEAYMFRGRTCIQITGRANYREFTKWVRSLGIDCPDFEQNPDAILQDPWEGLAPIWYWSTRNLNTFADNGNTEMITKRINGGLNGYGDRLIKYSTIGLAMLDFAYNMDGLKAFQVVAKSLGIYAGEVDGDDGPKTRAAIHRMLVNMGTVPVAATKAAPVTEVVPVAPKGADKVNMGRAAGVVATGAMGATAFVPDDPYIRLVLIGLAVVAVIVLVWKAELIASRVRTALNAFGLFQND